MQSLELPTLLTKKEVAELIRMSVRNLERRLAAGEIPSPFHLFGGKAPRWRRERIEAWMCEREEAETQKLETHK